MHTLPAQERGFVLIITMLIMLILTILVVNAIRIGTLSEKMAGNHMERIRAKQAAEQALRQGAALLANNGDICLSGCAPTKALAVVAANKAQIALPAAWSDTGAYDATIATNQKTTAQFNIALLADALLPPDKLTCKGYSIMGRGTGLNNDAIVILQTVAHVCPI